jgi:CxxC motif-containing protein (DUF1111 family)
MHPFSPLPPPDRKSHRPPARARAGRLARLTPALPALLILGLSVALWADSAARDPGVRGGPPGAGQPFPTLTAEQQAFFDAGQESFASVNTVQGDDDPGLGPRFNLDSCAGCHAHPAVGGTSPFVNPQVAVATKDGATNTVPFFILPDGPVREVRFKQNRDGTPDGGVHQLYTITGRTDAPGCVLAQPNFEAEARRDNLTFRIPTPVFGAGLIAAVTDATILANLAANAALKRSLGIGGRANRNGNDGTITRFGWKAQNVSLPVFSGEAYNVEQGVTNELFPNEIDQTPGCTFSPTPEDRTNLAGATPVEVASDIVKFPMFMQFLAPPRPAPETPSIARGRAAFAEVGCALCHTPTLTTGPSAVAVLANRPANLFSDLALHRMGPGLADGIRQGSAGPDEFRTAPLWGLGQRIFFLHDGRTRDLNEAILVHASESHGPSGFSEANGVVLRYRGLPERRKQDLLNFLRSL